MRIRLADEWIAGINVMLLRLELTAHILIAPTILSLLIRTISTRRRRPAVIFAAQFYVGTHHSILSHFVLGLSLPRLSDLLSCHSEEFALFRQGNPNPPF